MSELQAIRDRGTKSETHSELIFVDANAESSLQKVEAILTCSLNCSQQIRVFELDTATDGVDYITRTLAGHCDVQTVHLVCQGGDGHLRLGNVYLCDANMESYASRIASWQMAFSTEAEIRIYGCDLDSASGERLVDDLAMLASTQISLNPLS